jgi:MFS family permease
MEIRPVRLIVALCVAQVLSMAGFSTFPALLPTFIGEWAITNTEAGWINSTFFAGYLAAVPVLVSLTDRVEARRIYLGCMALSAVSALAFAGLAAGVWSASLLRVAAGIGLAGTYMPGLKALSDTVQGKVLNRAVAFYTASFGIGTSLSFFLSGKVALWLDWRWAFGLATAGPLLAFVLAWRVLPVRCLPPLPPKPLAGFGQVLRNPRVMGYVLAYCMHNWELFAMRAWLVAFLTFSWTRQPNPESLIAPTTLAAAVNLMGLPASVLGNELAALIGRRRHVVLAMTASALLACGLGFTAAWPVWAVAALCLLYGALVMADSSAVTTGTVTEATPELKGTTMAVHSCIGFAGSFLGPVAVGIVLDAGGGGQTVASWGLAYIATGGVAILGPVLLLALHHGTAPAAPHAAVVPHKAAPAAGAR